MRQERRVSGLLSRVWGPIAVSMEIDPWTVWVPLLFADANYVKKSRSQT